MGSLAGAGIGVGVGYATHKDKPRDIRRRNALVGGVTGAGIGALAGGMATPTPQVTELIQQGIDPSRARKMQQDAGNFAIRNFIQNIPVGVPMSEADKVELLKGMV